MGSHQVVALIGGVEEKATESGDLVKISGEAGCCAREMGKRRSCRSGMGWPGWNRRGCSWSGRRSTEFAFGTGCGAWAAGTAGSVVIRNTATAGVHRTHTRFSTALPFRAGESAALVSAPSEQQPMTSGLTILVPRVRSTA